LEQKRLLTGKISKYPLSQRYNFELGPETQDVETIKVPASKQTSNANNAFLQNNKRFLFIDF
jgi:hypothetical protein